MLYATLEGEFEKILPLQKGQFFGADTKIRKEPPLVEMLQVGLHKNQRGFLILNLLNIRRAGFV